MRIIPLNWLALLVLLALTARAQTNPTAVTLPATNIVALEGIAVGTLHGTVNPGGTNTTAWFEWGVRLNYGNTTPPFDAGNGTNLVPTSATLSNLTAGLVYHYRIVASNSFGFVRGKDRICWAAAFSGPKVMTNECHVPYVDSTAATAAPQAVTAGVDFTVFLRADGTLATWGTNFASPGPIPSNATNVTSVATSGYYTLALKDDGSLVGWGLNDFGQLSIPPEATNVVAVAAGIQHCLALREDGSLITWGSDPSGSLSELPVGATNVMAIAAGAYSSVVLKSDQTLLGWGDGNLPLGVTNAIAVSTYTAHGLALKTNGSVISWGADFYGQATVPASATNVVAIAAGLYHSLALRENGTVIGWGAGGPGSSDYPNYGQSTIPADATNVIAIAAGLFQSMAIRADGSAIGWGMGLSYGGQGPEIPTDLNVLNIPVSVAGSINVESTGNYVFTYRVTNAIGAISTGTRTIVVADTQPPLVTLLGANPWMLEVGSPFVDAGATASDLCAGDLTGSLLSTGRVNTNVPGTYLVNYSVTDANGFTGSTNRTVLVVTRPSLVVPPQAGDGSFQFNFTNTSGAQFNVLTATNVSLPLDQWTLLGPVTEAPPGEFHFTHANATNDLRFYRVKGP